MNSQQRDLLVSNLEWLLESVGGTEITGPICDMLVEIQCDSSVGMKLRLDEDVFVDVRREYESLAKTKDQFFKFGRSYVHGTLTVLFQICRQTFIRDWDEFVVNERNVPSMREALSCSLRTFADRPRVRIPRWFGPDSFDPYREFLHLSKESCLERISRLEEFWITAERLRGRRHNKMVKLIRRFIGKCLEPECAPGAST